MHTLISLSLSLLPTLLVSPGPGQDETGFEPLFDGKSLAGWVRYTDGKPPLGWHAEEGSLCLEPGDGDLRTIREYDHFEFRFDWKISAQGNSGVMYRVKAGDGQSYFSGPEYQVLDDAGSGLTSDSVHGAASLYGLYPAPGKALKNVGEFNSARIVVQGNHVEHWLNGAKVVEATLHSPDWNARVAASKFKEWPQFGAQPLGSIVLQDHGNAVCYRNLRLRPLPPPEAEGEQLMDLTTSSSLALLQARAADENLVVLDVRTPEEYAGGHLPGARNLDFFGEDFTSGLDELDKGVTYLVYCRSGGRSAKTLAQMKDLGFVEAYNMLGGFTAWSQEAKPSEK